ncbi:ThuA domain-containing protein [Paractinoplanes maris]|uniref:ThuA domain-containing protein n=1 Tax=Paractinoplanes maris TaxID=1734446 RepID=UPI00201FC74D|nr:ThuA domain-containing protein [Actinoplanes maris]
MRKVLAAAATLVALAACTFSASPASAADAPYDVLVFSKTAGFRHDAIPVGIQTIRDLGAANNFTVTATEDANAFTTANLAQYETVVFLNTTGDVLNAPQQTAFESYVRGGGGYAGVHAAADTEYDWPFYGQLVGAYFDSHPAIQQVTARVQNRAHPSSAHLPQSWTRTDELYNYRTNPRSGAAVLATLDESTYSGGNMGADHPISWCKTVDSGRSWYTGFGHTQASYAEANFRSHLLGGIRYAANRAKADCRPETGYTALYNGSTTGWTQAGPGSFTNTDATLSSTGGMGLYWYSAKQFTSYSLKADWRLTGDSNSGIFVGFPNPNNDPWVAVNQGYEVQIDATDAVDRTTGAIYTFKSADVAARDAALNPAGEWNSYELLVEGQRIRVYLNGKLVNDFTNTDPARNLDGYIGIQNHGAGDQAAFRNIRVKELTGQPPVTNLALGKAATASSVENASYPAANAVDASATTRWSSAFGDPQWVQVDLGATYNVNRVRLLWEAAYGSAYQIQTSTNGTTWTTARSVTGGNGGEDDLTGLNSQARYVRVLGTTRATQWGYSLFTFEVYGN